MLKRLLVLVMVLSLPIFAACSDDESSNGDEDTTMDVQEDTAADTQEDTEEDTADDTGDDTAEDTAGDSTGDTTEDTADVSDEDAMEMRDVSDMEDIPMVSMSCDEAGLTECFWNDDCEAAERCQDIGSGDVAVPCCVAGPRGTGVAGDACEQDIDCETSLCIEGLCSDVCETNDQCPNNMQCNMAVGLCRPRM